MFPGSTIEWKTQPQLGSTPSCRRRAVALSCPCIQHHMTFAQEETSSLRNVDQSDPSSLMTAEVAALPSPAPQVLDQKEEDSKRETVDEE